MVLCAVNYSAKTHAIMSLWEKQMMAPVWGIIYLGGVKHLNCDMYLN